MKTKSVLLYVLILLTLAPGLITAQIESVGIPWSFSEGMEVEGFQQISIAPSSAEDRGSHSGISDSPYKPEQFAQLLQLDIRPTEKGTLEGVNNNRTVWRLKLSIEGNLATSLYFHDFQLPEGVQLFVYSADKKEVKGAFTSNNNVASGYFATSLIHSDEVVIELNIPAGMSLEPWFTISEISYSDPSKITSDNTLGFGTSDFCEVNVNCSPEGDNWQEQKRGVVRIQVKANGNLYWCTGTVVNNTAFDKTPYVLTADHCAYKSQSYASAADLESWIFYFNYESETCENPTQEPELFSMVGCEKIAHGGFRGLTGSDFFLVELLTGIPNEWNVYYNGWSALDQTSDFGVTIHHPDGDIKKISTYDEELTTVSWQGSGLPSHWRVVWVQTENNHGVTEGGSSGAPIYDSEGRIMGTLTGGLATCYNADAPDYYGKFSYHWESNGDHDTTQLKPWLDPINTGYPVLTGTSLGINEAGAAVRDLSLNLHPNPVDAALEVVLRTLPGNSCKLQLINLTGTVVLTDHVNPGERSVTLSVDKLPAGIYFLKGSSGGESIVRKFIKR